MTPKLSWNQIICLIIGHRRRASNPTWYEERDGLQIPHGETFCPRCMKYPLWCTDNAPIDYEKAYPNQKEPDFGENKLPPSMRGKSN